MHNHYRDKFDIIASILGITNGNEIRQVDILSKANIPHNIFIKYMIVLHQYGLIEIEHMQHPSQRTYRITGKGIHFLDICNKLRTLYDISSSKNKPHRTELSVVQQVL
jgi:predicted transcriptional regulator